MGVGGRRGGADVRQQETRGCRNLVGHGALKCPQRRWWALGTRLNSLVIAILLRDSHTLVPWPLA